MTRKLNRNYSLSVVAAFFVILILLIAAAVLAQVTGADRPSGEANAVSAPSGTSAPAQAGYQLTPRTDSTEQFPIGRSQTQPHGASPMDSNPLFLPAVSYDSQGSGEGGGLGRTVAVADLNGDGIPDIVVTNFWTYTIAVLLGNGDGTFQAGAWHSPGGTKKSPSAIAIADVNGDGKPDLIVGLWEVGVSVMLGNGDGTFQSPVIYSSGGPQVTDVAVADVNGDGKPDLIVVNFGANVGVLLGNGDGTFQKAVLYSSGSSACKSVAVADVNGDGKPDLVVANQDGTVGVMLGNGDGTFQPAVTYGSGGSEPWSVAVADVNGDGKLDIVVANCGATSCDGSEGSVGVLLGNGDGTFQAALTFDSGGGYTWGVAVADVNGDGKPDVLTSNTNSNNVGVLLGNGDGTFQPPLTFGSGGYYPVTIVATDVNRDGRPDLVVENEVWNNADGTVGVLLNDKPTTITLASSPNPSILGQPVTFTSVVSSAFGTPIGSVVFYDGSNAIGSASLAGGNASLSTSSLSAGSHSITAAYQSYDGFGPSTSEPLIQVVNGINTTTALVSSTNPSVFAQAVTFTAAVSSGSGTPTGAVIFYDGSTAIGSATLANGSASISISSMAAGSHSIAAAYQGAGAFLPSNSAPLNQVVNPETTTTSLASSLNPALVTDPVTYTATVASQNGGAVTGTIVFQDGSSTVATVTVVGNQAAYSTKYSKPGTHSMTGTYSGDTNNIGSVSAVLVEQINKGFTSKTVVTTSGSPSFVGQQVTFIATLTSTHGTIPDGEVVTFYDGTTAIDTGTTAGGVATFTTSSLTAKTHIIKGTYAGDAIFETSSGTVEQLVDRYPTTTAVSSSLNPSNYGQAVTLTATVAPTGPYQPTGKVTFRTGSAWLGSGTLNASGVATLTTGKIPVGAGTLTATYNGDVWNAKSVSAAITQTVSQASISMVLTSTPNPSASGKSVKFTATLTSNGGLPSGQPVTFSYNNATLGTVNLNSKGVATFSTTTLPQGSDAVTAAYAGTVDYSSASATVTQVVN